MSCEEIPEKLIDLAYGELPPEEAERLGAHVTACETCRREWESIVHNGELLDRAASEAAQLPPALESSRVWGAVHQREQQRARRWRRLALGAVAATVLLAVASLAMRRIEVHPSHAVIRWGETPPPAPAPPPRPDPAVAQLRGELAEARRLLAEQGRRLDDLDQLAGLIVDELKDDDVRFTSTVRTFDVRLDALRRQNDERWQAVGRGFHDWFLAQRLEPSESSQASALHPSVQGDLP